MVIEGEVGTKGTKREGKEGGETGTGYDCDTEVNGVKIIDKGK